MLVSIVVVHIRWAMMPVLNLELGSMFQLTSRIIMIYVRMAALEEEALVDTTAAEVVVKEKEKEKGRMVTVDSESAGTSGMHHNNAYVCIY